MVQVTQRAVDAPALIEGDQQVGFWVRCSACGEDVTPDRPGIVVWDPPENLGLHVGRVDAFHKGGPCDPKSGRWLDLDRFLGQLGANST